MGFNEEIYELIERYLLGEMQTEELSAFEKRLKDEKELAQEVEIHKELFLHFEGNPHNIKEREEKLEEFLDSKEASSFQDKLKDVLEQHKIKDEKVLAEDKKIKVRKLNWKPLSLVASILLLVGVFYFMNKEGGSPQELYALYDVPSKMNLVNKGVNDENISKIELAFNKGKYQAANKILQPVLDTMNNQHPNWFDLKLAHGVSLLQLNETEKAKGIFIPLKNSDFIDAPKANWQYILTLLKEGKEEDVLKEIDLYISSGHEYKLKEIKEIYQEMN